VAFVGGLRGGPGKHVKMQMPDTVDRALIMAIAATQAEQSERDTTREGKDDMRAEFTVRGHRQSTRSEFEVPQHKNQSSRCRGRSSSNGMAGFGAPGKRGAFKGSCSFRTDCQTAVSRDTGLGLDHGRHLGTDWREQAPEPKDGDDHRARQGSDQGTQCYNCGAYKHFRRYCRRGRDGRPRGYPGARGYPNEKGKGESAPPSYPSGSRKTLCVNGPRKVDDRTFVTN
jgi:hypothetical protein